VEPKGEFHGSAFARYFLASSGPLDAFTQCSFASSVA
jgi:hypothetical protein